MKEWLKIATEKKVVQRACIYSMVVGTILTIINHGPNIIHGRFESEAWIQILLTVMVPYFVTTTSSVSALRGLNSKLDVEGFCDPSVVEVLKEQVLEIRSFPEQNPNPVLKVSSQGKLVYANQSSIGILNTWGNKIDDILNDSIQPHIQKALQTNEIQEVDLNIGVKYFSFRIVAAQKSTYAHIYATDITAAKFISKFPEQNPNPVLKTTPDGKLLYSNGASLSLIKEWNINVGDHIPGKLWKEINTHLCSKAENTLEINIGKKNFSLKVVYVEEFDFVNIYGTDISAEKVIKKFPEQNPNPVLKVTRDGKLIYANEASRYITRAWRVNEGNSLPEEISFYINKTQNIEDLGPIEIPVANHHYRFSFVEVSEFDFINIYGTDITDSRKLEIANRENERLLLNILPVKIAERLKNGEGVIADKFENASVLFADIVGFTELSSRMQPTDLLNLLNRVFSEFDKLTEKYQMEKIKTIGDAYMVVGGISDFPNNHIEEMANMALEMSVVISKINDDANVPLSLRIGLHAGPVVAGVIGLKKFIYDVWGDTVNTASRMESHSETGKIQVTSFFYNTLCEKYNFQDRGEIDIKGKGLMKTYFLLNQKPEEN